MKKFGKVLAMALALVLMIGGSGIARAEDTVPEPEYKEGLTYPDYGWMILEERWGLIYPDYSWLLEPSHIDEPIYPDYSWLLEEPEPGPSETPPVGPGPSVKPHEPVTPPPTDPEPGPSEKPHEPVTPPRPVVEPEPERFEKPDAPLTYAINASSLSARLGSLFRPVWRLTRNLVNVSRVS